jgi:hypothetical protein
MLQKLTPRISQVAFRESAQIPPDLRAYAHALLTTLPTQSLIPYVHPRFYSLHNMPTNVRDRTVCQLRHLRTDFALSGWNIRRERSDLATCAQFDQRAIGTTRFVPHRGFSKHIPLGRPGGGAAISHGRL